MCREKIKNIIGFIGNIKYICSLIALALAWYGTCKFFLFLDANMWGAIILFTGIFGFYWLVLLVEEIEGIFKKKKEDKED